jgi:AcrR family transcriptional regulator
MSATDVTIALMAAPVITTRLPSMVRWEPGARERLQAAALDLFISRGFEKTTTAEIAQAVGLTERTFFRHFADKREVLFHGQHLLEEAFLKAVAATTQEASALEMVASALSVVAGYFPDERRGYSRRRQIVISENVALQERELLKLAQLAAAVTTALRARGVPESAARLAAASAVTVFGVTFRTWIAEDEERSFQDIEEQVLAELVTMAAEHHGSTH